MPRAIALKPNEVRAIPLTCLIPDPENPRKNFDEASIKDMGISLKAHGQIQPAVVRPNGTAGKYFIVVGERRWRGAKLAKLKTLDCVLEQKRTGEDAEFKRLAAQWAENMDREGFNDIEIAKFFKTCRDDFEMTAAEIPRMLKQYGITKTYSDSYIRNIIRLLDLPAWAQKLIEQHELTAAHGKTLLTIKDHPELIKLAQTKIKRSLAASKKNKERYTTNDLACDLNGIADDKYPGTNPAFIHPMMDLDTTRPLYKITKQNEESLKIVSIPSHYSNGKLNHYITNLEVHKELQEKEKIKLKEKWKKAEQREKAKQKKSSKNASTEKNIEPRQTGLVDFVNGWLQESLISRLANIDDSEVIKERLIYWQAHNQPSAVYVTYDDKLRCSYLPCDIVRVENEIKDGSVIKTGVFTLQGFVEQKIDEAAVINNLMERAVNSMNLKHRCYLARYLKIDIDKDFRVDDIYLKLYTKDGLLALANAAGLDDTDGNPPISRKPATELRQYLIDNASEKIGCPSHVTDLIESAFQEYQEDVKISAEQKAQHDEEQGSKE